MEQYYHLSLVFSGYTSLLLLYVLVQRRYLFAKPSMWFITFFHIQIQWPACLSYDMIWDALNEPYLFLYLTQLFPAVTLSIVFFTFRKDARIIWNTILRSVADDDITPYIKILAITLPLSYLVILIYLMFVPLTSTGFYHIFVLNSDALTATIAREDSLKLLPYTWLKYLFQFFARFLALISSSILTIIILKRGSFSIYGIIVTMTCLGLILSLMIGCVLPGARIGGLLVVLCCVSTFYFYRVGNVNYLYIFMGVFVGLMAPMYTQFMKYHLKFTLDNVMGVITEVVVKRALAIPMQAGIQWVQYVDSFGYFGAAAVPKLAFFMGIKDTINAPNFLMNYYYGGGGAGITTGNLNVSYVFSYYCYFGINALPFLLFSVVIIDLWVYLYRLIRQPYVLPTMVTLNLAVINLVSSEYITMFITYCFFTGLVFMYFSNEFLKYRYKVK